MGPQDRKKLRGDELAQLVKHVTLDLGGFEFKPHAGCRDHLKKKKKEKKTKTNNSKHPDIPIAPRGPDYFYSNQKFPAEFQAVPPLYLKWLVYF